jgi:ribonuclease P protein component
MITELPRLKRRADFLRVAARRNQAVRPGLLLQVAPRLEAESDVGAHALRVGYTASRRVGNAVLRNRAKRRLRAAAAEVLARDGRPGMDYVLVARAATPARAYRDLVDDLATALRQVERPRRGTGGRPGEEAKNDA